MVPSPTRDPEYQRLEHWRAEWPLRLGPHASMKAQCRMHGKEEWRTLST